MARFTLHGATLKFSTYSKVIRIGAICTHTEGLDYFVVTRNSHPSPGLGTVKTVLSWPKTYRPPTGTGKKGGTATL